MIKKNTKSIIILTILLGLTLSTLFPLSIQAISSVTDPDEPIPSQSFSVVELWKYNITSDSHKMVMSADLSSIALTNDTHILFFNSSSNSTLWTYDMGYGSSHVDISADGEYIIAGLWNGTIYLFNKSVTVPKKPILKYDIGGPTRDVAISGNGDYIAATSGTPNNTLYLFNNSNPSGPVLTWKYNASNGLDYDGLAISATGEYITMLGYFEVYLFNNSYADPKTPVWMNTTTYSAGGIDISPDGDYIVAGEGNPGSDEGYIHLFDNTYSTTKQAIWSYPTNCDMGKAAISANGNYVAVSKNSDNSPVINSTLYYLSTTGSNPKTSLWEYECKTNSPEFRTISITADGKYIAAGTGGVPTAYMFNSDASASKQPLWTAIGNVVDIQLSLDGRYMCLHRNNFGTDGIYGNLTFYQVNLPSYNGGEKDDDDDDETQVGLIPMGYYFLPITLFGIAALTILIKRKVSNT